jgi:hypothetical protein
VHTAAPFLFRDCPFPFSYLLSVLGWIIFIEYSFWVYFIIFWSKAWWYFYLKVIRNSYDTQSCLSCTAVIFLGFLWVIPWLSTRLFYFLALFLKDSLKYAFGGKILKNRPLSCRHGRRRQGNTAWRQSNWRQDLNVWRWRGRVLAPWSLAPRLGATLIGTKPGTTDPDAKTLYDDGTKLGANGDGAKVLPR